MATCEPSWTIKATWKVWGSTCPSLPLNRHHKCSAGTMWTALLSMVAFPQQTILTSMTALATIMIPNAGALRECAPNPFVRHTLGSDMCGRLAICVGKRRSSATERCPSAGTASTTRRSASLRRWKRKGIPRKGRLAPAPVYHVGALGHPTDLHAV